MFQVLLLPAVYHDLHSFHYMLPDSKGCGSQQTTGDFRVFQNVCCVQGLGDRHSGDGVLVPRSLRS